MSKTLKFRKHVQQSLFTLMYHGFAAFWNEDIKILSALVENSWTFGSRRYLTFTEEALWVLIEGGESQVFILRFFWWFYKNFLRRTFHFLTRCSEKICYYKKERRCDAFMAHYSVESSCCGCFQLLLFKPALLLWQMCLFICIQQLQSNTTNLSLQCDTGS